MIGRKIGGTALIFMAGADFERFINGGTDAFFGTRWLLLTFIVSMMLVGMSMLRARIPREAA
jgi:hypothetical protein